MTTPAPDLQALRDRVSRLSTADKERLAAALRADGEPELADIVATMARVERLLERLHVRTVAG